VRTRLLNAVLLAAVVYAVSRLWLFLGEPPPVLPEVTAGVTAPAAGAAKSGNSVAAVEFRPEAYEVIVARDLFSPARGIVAPAPQAAARPAPKPPAPPKLTLYGVVIVDGEKTAYLQEGTQEARPKKVRENENIAGGVVKAIRPDGITFLFAGTEMNVPLRAAKDGAGAPAPRAQDAAPTVSRPEAPPAFPRRLVPPSGIPQVPIPALGRQVPGQPGMPTVAPRGEPGSEDFGDEQFPEGPPPGGEPPGMVEEEVGN